MTEAGDVDVNHIDSAAVFKREFGSEYLHHQGNV
jgi:hypothetical protein